MMSQGEYTGKRISLLPNGYRTLFDLSGKAVSKWEKKGKWAFYDNNGNKTVIQSNGGNPIDNFQLYSLRRQSIYEYFGIE